MDKIKIKIKSVLLELLEDNEIKDIILKIVHKNDLSSSKELENKIYDLERKLELITKERNDLRKTNDEIERTIKSQEDSIKGLSIRNIELENSLNKNTLSEVEADSILELMTQYNLYKNMPESAKISLKYIIDDSNPLNFYSCGMQERAIDAFWELLKEDIFSGAKNENLNSIFEYFFKNSYSGLSKETFIPLETRIGDKYREEEHIKAPGSRQLGEISKVLLLGYTKNGNNKIEKKSIVVI